MFVARDQENRIFAHQTGAVNKQQGPQPKTPGTRYPKTPLKVPLNDDNATRTLGGKSILGGRTNGGNENIQTIGKGGQGGPKTNFKTPIGT